MGLLRLRRWVNDPLIEIMLSLLTPFLAFWPPVHLGGSGVLATLAAGLYTSWNGPRLISPATRLQGVFFWEFFTYVLEGMVFLITGLQARTVIGRISHYPLSQLALSVAVITAVVIVARFIWVFPAAYLPRWLFPPVRKKDPSPRGSGHSRWHSLASAASFRSRQRLPFRLPPSPVSHFLIAI